MKTLKHLFAAMLLLCSMAVNAHDFEVDGIYYNISNSYSKTVSVTYFGTSNTSAVYSGEVVIPATVTYDDVVYSVTSIGYHAFYGCSGLTKVEIPNSVVNFDSYAFYGCSGLTNMEIPNGVTSIGYYAFYGCSGLTGVEIPNSVTNIGHHAFYGCSGLTNVIISNNVKSISSSAFSGCSKLTNVEIPNNVTSIATYAFSGCSNLASIEIPNSVKSIEGNAFSGCNKLKTLFVGSGVTSIGDNAFGSCNALEEIIVKSENVVYDSKNNCNAIIETSTGRLIVGCKNTVIPNSVTSIGSYAFSGCSKLTSINIPNSVTSIGSYAFSNCTGLTSLEIPNSITLVDANAFYGCNLDYLYMKGVNPPAITSNSFSNINKTAVIVPDVAVANYRTATVWSNFSTRIVSDAKYKVNVNVSALSNTSGVLEVIGDDVIHVVDIKVTGSINSYDVIIFRDKMPNLKVLDISETTVVASNKAFYNGNCTSENNLGNYAFYDLSKLNYVKLPKDLVAIGSSMFRGCSMLREIEIPETVQRVGSEAFYNCSALTNIKMPKEIETIGTSAFYGCSNLKEIVIPKGVVSLPGYYNGVFENCSKLEKVTLPDGLKEIGYVAFCGCSKLKEIKLPPTVKTIGNEAFYNCSSLEEIRIPSTVESIGTSAFGGCSKLNKVYAYTVEPTNITESTFSTFQTATLYIPSFSELNYYWDDGWKRFLNHEVFNEPYDYFYINNDYILNDETGYIEGVDGNAPDADINVGGGLIIEGEQGDEEDPKQNLGDVNVEHNGENGGSIIGDNNLHIDDLHIKITVVGGRWYFFAFPFDVKLNDIYMKNGSDYVFRYYDGEERAKNGNGGWKDVNGNKLKAAQGYIFQCSANDVLVLSIKDVKFKKEDKYNELIAHVSDNLKDASWNFVGNPYLSYYDIADMDYSAPVTVWDGEKYVAIRPGDDDYCFAPYEAFFVQKPESQKEIVYDGDKQMTYNQSNEKMTAQSAAARTRGINSERYLINIVLGDGTTSDRTRIVFNEQQSFAYETACDASKFETKGVVQVYTIGDDNIHYAINERPVGNGRVALGYSVPASGLFTIEAARMDVDVVLVDTKSGVTHNLAEGGYTFSSDAGTFNGRFEVRLSGAVGGTTAVDEVEKDDSAEVVYDLLGRKVKKADKGVYIIDGEKVVK